MSLKKLQNILKYQSKQFLKILFYFKKMKSLT